MAEKTFVGQINKNSIFEPEDNMFGTIWAEYERVIVESLITSFGLDFIIKDRYGGDVDTILNVRKVGSDSLMTYKNEKNRLDYQNKPEYNSNSYHSDDRYKEINAKVAGSKDEGTLIDAYTGKKVKANEKVDLDHVIAAKEIYDDQGRILAGLEGEELANSEENLRPTDRSINRSMKQTDIDDYLRKWKENQPERQKRIKELKGRKSLSDKERKELAKLEKLEEIDPERMKKENAHARKSYEAKLAKAYYTSPQFMKDTAEAAGKRGVEMGLRQVLGFIFVEIWFCAKEEIQSMPSGCELKEMLKTVGRGIKKGFKSAKTKYKELIAKVEEGFAAGALSSLTTTICNIFFTTAKNLVKCIRQIYASVVQAGKVLLFNPDNLTFGDRIKTAAVIIATGASVLAGTAVGELIAVTPLGRAPVIGNVVRAFCSTLVSGLLSCTLLVFLDRSKLINAVMNGLNRIPSEVGNYAAIADAMERLAAKLSRLDIDLFRRETEKYRSAAEQIAKCESDDELNAILLATYKALDVKIPWEGDFDSFMGDKSNKLVFS